MNLFPRPVGKVQESPPAFSEPMEMVYLKSPTGLHHKRAAEVLGRVREALPDLKYREVDPREDPDYAAQFHIKYAPGIVIDGRIEFVGIPRTRMVLDRIRQLRGMAAPAKEKPAEEEDAA